MHLNSVRWTTWESWDKQMWYFFRRHPVFWDLNNLAHLFVVKSHGHHRIRQSPLRSKVIYGAMCIEKILWCMLGNMKTFKFNKQLGSPKWCTFWEAVGIWSVWTIMRFSIDLLKTERTVSKDVTKWQGTYLKVTTLWFLIGKSVRWRIAQYLLLHLIGPFMYFCHLS